MKPPQADDHLSQIATLWTLVGRANADAGPELRSAQRQLLERYGGAVRRYLRAVVRDSDAADELFQEFAYRFVHGKLKGADPRRGRFRDYVKGVLFHLVTDHRRGELRRPRPLPADCPEPAAADATPDLDAEFLSSWRQELLARAWSALRGIEAESGRPLYTVLRYRAEHPDTPSPQLARELADGQGRSLTAAGVRQILHRAREKFADLLLDEVVQSLQQPNPEALQEELVQLELLEYCRPGLARRGRSVP